MKTALVTGSARGIGRAICEELARSGVAQNIVVCDVQKEWCEETVLSAKDAAARIGRTTARVRQLAQAGVLRRGYGGYLAESVDALLWHGLPRKPRKEQPKHGARRGARRAGA